MTPAPWVARRPGGPRALRRDDDESAASESPRQWGRSAPGPTCAEPHQPKAALARSMLAHPLVRLRVDACDALAPRRPPTPMRCCSPAQKCAPCDQPSGCLLLRDAAHPAARGHRPWGRKSCSPHRRAAPHTREAQRCRSRSDPGRVRRVPRAPAARRREVLPTRCGAGERSRQYVTGASPWPYRAAVRRKRACSVPQ